MEKALMIMGNSPSEIAEALVQFAKSYSATRESEKQPVIETEKMTTRQAAKFAGVCVKTFLKWVNEGLIPYYGSDRKRFFVKNEIIEAIKKLK